MSHVGYDHMNSPGEGSSEGLVVEVGRCAAPASSGADDQSRDRNASLMVGDPRCLRPGTSAIHWIDDDESGDLRP